MTTPRSLTTVSAFSTASRTDEAASFPRRLREEESALFAAVMRLVFPPPLRAWPTLTVARDSSALATDSWRHGDGVLTGTQAPSCLGQEPLHGEAGPTLLDTIVSTEVETPALGRVGITIHRNPSGLRILLTVESEGAAEEALRERDNLLRSLALAGVPVAAVEIARAANSGIDLAKEARVPPKLARTADEGAEPRTDTPRRRHPARSRLNIIG